MNHQQYTEIVEREGTRLLEAASEDLDAAVPACPDWDVANVVGHVGQVHGWIAATVAACSTDRPTHPFPEVPAREQLLDWGQARLDELLASFRAMRPGTPCWNWGPGDTVDFFPRRMAHETIVHRHDVEAAVGAVTAIDSDVAADGVDELVHVGMQRSSNPKKEFTYPAGSLHLHRTDGEGEWLLRVEDGALVATREHAKGDVAVRGSGSDLLLYLWGRGGSDLEIFGDSELAAAWAAVAP